MSICLAGIGAANAEEANSCPVLRKKIGLNVAPEEQQKMLDFLKTSFVKKLKAGEMPEGLKGLKAENLPDPIIPAEYTNKIIDTSIVGRISYKCGTGYIRDNFQKIATFKFATKQWNLEQLYFTGNVNGFFEKYAEENLASIECTENRKEDLRNYLQQCQ